LVNCCLFHTLGELCISPVGLSYVSKLVPPAWYNVWCLLFVYRYGNKLAGSMGGMIETITAQYSLTTFFLIFYVVPIGAGLVMILSPLMKS
jgi:POT family proton-dependent oligopeptide transporter